ncbi:hypothetical protein DICPUDRAFT_96317 [Dictyostelium purpureum]|uniref:Protein SEY1 homolog n=1 Tax=Dictyostelium purpureum TaxID=5786 RepID=F0Z788_DICPU|nr:uncharacterized protein DICPUDRAFT_96317 [Dictyostelium purpureum]EGC40202.1 hypothetical protein DICPUDRAFT_96317 [Dictyostelium purpureum]|eukprot:XP_003283271.1 hypothetical protein DICPUDRAFT_96317 [Dictyostelium purpureum]
MEEQNTSEFSQESTIASFDNGSEKELNGNNSINNNESNTNVELNENSISTRSEDNNTLATTNATNHTSNNNENNDTVNEEIEPSKPTYNDIVQFIDHNGDIVKDNGKNTFLATISNREDFLNKGFDYSVISILGPQSSGKSTLLNYLFNTKFAVMDGLTGRKQTTQGVWMGVATPSSASKETYLILDVEGTDGRERGEDEKAFERKTSLFSLALSSVLIINMWAHDIGRYNAANISLLKTVFELNLQLFQHKRNHKILIFFIIRDHDGVTPLNELKRILLEDISKLWSDLQKPDEFKSKRETDFFEFDFTSLPHKIYSNEQFMKQVEALKTRFVDPKLSNFIPKVEYRNDDIPADGFYQFSYQVWETIKSNRDLDLPSQKEMLALYRCDEFVEKSMSIFNKELRTTKESIEKGRIQENFGEKSKRIIDQALEIYDEPASRYHQETVVKKRQVLYDRMFTELKYLFDKQMERLFENAMDFYKSLIKEFSVSSKDSSASSSNIKRDGSSSPLTAASAGIIPQFSIWSEGVKKKSVEYFEGVAKQSIVQGSDWTFSEQLEELKQKLDKELESLKETQLNRLSKLMRDKTFQELTPNITKVTEQAPNDMWSKIKRFYEDAVSTNEKEFRDRLNDFSLDQDKALEIINKFKEQLSEGLKTKITERAEFLQMRMRKRFEEKFNMDSRNLPRKWTKHDDIGAIFQEARQNAEKLIDLFSYLRLDEDDLNISFFKKSTEKADEYEENTMVNANKIIIPFKDCLNTCEHFRQNIKSDYMQALSEQNRLTTGGGVPAYMILLLCVLGFNEFIAILSSPLLFILTILLACGGVVLYKLGLSGPFLDYSSQFLVHFINKVKDIVLHVEQLSEHNNNNNKVKKD